MKLGYDLTIEQSQKLVMTPELIQAIQILQFNTQELDSYVSEQLLTNPVLEIGHSKNEDPERTEESRSEKEKESDQKDDPLSEYLKEKVYDDISYRHSGYSGEKKEVSYERFVTDEVTLPENLMFQLQFVTQDNSQRKTGRYIIESLDDNGYLTSSTGEIAAATGVSEQEVEDTIRLIQTFDPPGICAPDLGTCLLIQLEQKGMASENYRKLITGHIEDLAANRLGVIAKSLGIPVHEVQKMCDMIKTLEPKPGRQFSSGDETRYIIPDVIVEKINGDYVITLNDSSIPHLMVSSYYEKVLAESGNDTKLTEYLSERLNSAVWLLKSIEQRRQTIMSVVGSIIKFQKGFFENGSRDMKTLTLRQIADDLGIHESTVSRSINGKYMQCPRGVYELKYFFPGGVTGDSGEGISSSRVKTFIKELIDEEDQRTPISDQVITERLSGHGIALSRRTVAKYREEMGILSSSKRKRY